MQKSRILADLGPPKARIRLCNPPLNVIDVAMMCELEQTLLGIEGHAEISMIVLEGDSNCFSAGVDVKAHVPEQVREMLSRFHAVIRAIVASRKITLAIVRGTCLGGGAELASVCDLVYTARDATWGFPEIRLGCYPPVGAVTLPALVGQRRAAELIFTGRQISGDEAAAIGLASRSVRAEELESMVQDTIGELQKLSPATLAHAKKAVYGWDAIHFEKGLARAEKIYLEELVSTADAQEGIMAFIEKRPPKWTGR